MISDMAADYIYTGDKLIDFALPGLLRVVCNYKTWQNAPDKQKYFPLYSSEEYLESQPGTIHFISVDTNHANAWLLIDRIQNNPLGCSLCVEQPSQCNDVG